MKPAFVSAIVFAFVVCLAPRSQAKQNPTNVTAPTQNQNPIATAPSFENKQASPDKNGGNKQPPNGDSPAQWILVIVTTITAGFICWQAWETRRAARAAADSVIAIQGQTSVLERQAKAIEEAGRATIRIERAFIDVYLIRTGEAVYQMEVTNCGRTVAKIKQYCLVPKLSPVIAVATDTFEHSRTIYCSKFLEPRDEPWISEELNLVQSLGREDFAAIWGKTKNLAYYGVVRYEDIAGELHETQFCYHFNAAPERRCLERGNADEYNKHT